MILEKELVNRKRPLDDFFNESELWREVYDIYWSMAPMKNRMKARTMMHDIRYICVCLNLDKDMDKYLVADTFDSYMKRAMAYVVFKAMNDLPQKISDFLPIMHIFLSKWDKFYIVEIELDKLLAKKNSYFVDLSAHPEPPKRIRFDYCKWNKLTNDFEKDAIVEVLALWKNRNDRIEILRMIEEIFKNYCWRYTFYLLEEKRKTIQNRFIELRGQLEGDNFLVEEIKRLYEENKQLKEKVKSLEGVKKNNIELMIAKHNGIKEGIKTLVDQLIAYGESFTSEQNSKAEIIQGSIMSLIFNKYIPEEVLDKAHRIRLNRLGKKEKDLSFNAESMFKISGNDQVNIGGNNGGQ